MEVWLFVVGSITIAEESPICVLIISPPASIARIRSCAIYPIIAPTAKFRSKSKRGEIPAGGAAGFKRGVSMIVKINTSASFTSPAISFLLKIGANLINPSSLAKTMKPAENQRSNSGNNIAICCIN